MKLSFFEDASRQITFADEAAQIFLASDFAEINRTKFNWSFQARQEVDKRFAGRDGVSTLDSFLSPDAGLKLTREVWRDFSLGRCAVRYLFENLSGQDFLLENIRVLDVKKMTLSGADPALWRAFLDRAEPMDGMPSAIRLGTFDDTAAGAVSGSVWVKPDFDLVRNAPTHTFPFENFGLFDGGTDESGKLVVGFVELAHHFADMEIAMDEDGKHFCRLTADAVFDCVVPPNGERATQFLAVFSETTHNRALDAYTDWLGRASGVPAMPSGRAPAVGCTWHFYGGAVTEAIVQENIEAKKTRSIPLDVYMIDDYWEPFYGDWNAIPSVFPHGMREIADRIREAGMRPGIWTAPFAVKPVSETAKRHPEMFFRDANGELVHFFGDFMIDPTAPGALRWIEDLYRRLHDDYGFTYFKLDKVDFPHPQWRSQKPVCHDRSVTLVEAYRMLLAKIRETVGKDSYICICGGHYGASIGLGDTQRSSGDTYGSWISGKAENAVPQQEYRLKQTLGRLHYRRIWMTNADGMELRRRTEPFLPNDFGLSRGLMTDDEARLMTVVHYLNGGIVMCGEGLPDIDDERLALYRHVIPSIDTLSRPLDLFHPWMPTQFATRIRPRCPELTPWNTISIVNYTGEKMTASVLLDGDAVEGLTGRDFLLFELVTGTFLGWNHAGGRAEITDIPPHAGRILKIIPADPQSGEVYLLGTDLHNSCGGVEIASWRSDAPGTAAGTIETPWTRYSVKITAFCGGKCCNTVVPPGEKNFYLDCRTTQTQETAKLRDGKTF